MTYTEVVDLKNKHNLSKSINRLGTTYYENEKGAIILKQCRGCQEVKNINEFFNDKRGLAGKTSRCIDCEIIRKRNYRINNYEKSLESGRKWKQKNREKHIRYNRKYYQENKEHFKNIRELNREKRNDQISEWKKRNPDYRKKYYIANRKKEIENSRKWRSENPEKFALAKKEWNKRNNESVRLMCQRRRTRKNDSPNTLTPGQLKEILKKFDYKCSLTGETENVQLDHVIPLSSSKSGTTKGNIIPLRGDLNSSKNNKNIFEWYENNKNRFGVTDDKFDSLISYLAELNDMDVESYKKYVYRCHSKAMMTELKNTNDM